MIKFNQNVRLKIYIDKNTQLRRQAKNDFGKGFFNLINNAMSEKTMGNLRKHRAIKLVTTERGGNLLLSLYHTTKLFTQ